MSRKARERGFEKVGGLREHIQTLREMIIFPLLYREVFEAHGVQAPRGVLFHGPPGTGKTLVAGALAAECSRTARRRVAFYMRKGADCLDKYVGESEKNLQDLFAQAQSSRPAIIFFDEIDGLVPTRSELHEHHSSVVSTLLALMDGLDAQSEVFVIGATNRIDMIDPALRRPGRFDRELYFPLPPLEARLQILQVHTRPWRRRPDPDFLLRLASECAGFCGADIQSLCCQAVMESFRRSYPQIASTPRKLKVDSDKLQVAQEDFWAAKEKVVPTSQRTCAVPARPLTPQLEPLLKRSLRLCLDFIQRACPFKFIHRDKGEFTKNKSITCPRALLAKNRDHGHIPYLASAVLHTFDHLPVTVIDLPTINDQTLRCSDSGSLVHRIDQARQSMPGIIFFPDIGSWWHLVDETARTVLVSLLEKLDNSLATHLFLLATSNATPYDDLPSEVRKIFPKNRALEVDGPLQEEKHNFFAHLLLQPTDPHRPPEPPHFTPALALPRPDPDTHSDDIPNNSTSRRQEGLDVEFLGMAFETKPHLGGYYRQHVQQQQAAPPFKRPPDISSRQLRNTKKLKTESCQAPSTPEGPPCKKELPNSGDTDLHHLLTLCVRKTSAASTESVIKLYEQVEIVLLRFTPTWDRSNLFQELQREITSFNPL